MNIFRLLGDLSHLLAIIILLLKIWKTRSCAGISGRSQLLFAITYTTRYLDLVLFFISIYNTVMKVVFIAASYATLYLMYVKFKATYDRHHDTFRVEFLLIPAVILSLVINHEFAPVEILWTFSIYLESVAILPQLFMVSKTGEAESITSHYLFALGSYRALYLFNWIYRYYAEDHYDLIAIVAGVVQTVLYCDFFYLYITKDESLFNKAIPVNLRFKQATYNLLYPQQDGNASPERANGFYSRLFGSGVLTAATKGDKNDGQIAVVEHFALSIDNGGKVAANSPTISVV